MAVARDADKSQLNASLMNYNVALYFFLINGRHLLSAGTSMNCFVSPPFAPHRSVLRALGFSPLFDSLRMALHGYCSGEKLKRTNGSAGGRSKRYSWLPLNSLYPSSFRVQSRLYNESTFAVSQKSIWIVTIENFDRYISYM